MSPAKEIPVLFHRGEEPRQRPWARPPANELGMWVPLRLLFVRTDEVVVTLVDVAAYSTGFALRLVVELRREGEQFDQASTMLLITGLRLGVQFGDGRKAASHDPRPPRDDEPPGISLRSLGGGGGGHRHGMSYWIYPVPPPGPLTFGLDWRDRIPEHTRHVDASPIIEAAQKSLVLWDDDRPYR